MINQINDNYNTLVSDPTQLIIDSDTNYDKLFESVKVLMHLIFNAFNKINRGIMSHLKSFEITN